MAAVPATPVVPTGRRVEGGCVKCADALVGGDDGPAEEFPVVDVVLDHQTVAELPLAHGLVDHDFVPAISVLQTSATNLV